MLQSARKEANRRKRYRCLQRAGTGSSLRVRGLSANQEEADLQHKILVQEQRKAGLSPNRPVLQLQHFAPAGIWMCQRWLLAAICLARRRSSATLPKRTSIKLPNFGLSEDRNIDKTDLLHWAESPNILMKLLAQLAAAFQC